MRTFWIALAVAALATPGAAAAAAKPHVIQFGKKTVVKLFVGPNEDSALQIGVQPLLVDGRIKEFVTGAPHDVTDRTFVVRRAYRINDYIDRDPGTIPRWKWQRGGWLLVNRDSGRVSQLTLPEFDPYYSAASWYRDYAAYCGVSDDGEKLYAVVTQIGRRRPIVRKDLGAAHAHDLPESECPAPDWERQPTRVTFAPVGGAKLTFEVRGHAADIAETEAQ
jgi:hypothetical protein